MKLHLSSPLQSAELCDFIQRMRQRFPPIRVRLYRFDPSLRFVQGVIGSDERGCILDLAPHLYSVFAMSQRTAIPEADDFAPLHLRHGVPPHPHATLHPFPAVTIPLRASHRTIGIFEASDPFNDRPISDDLISEATESEERIAEALASFDVTLPEDLLGVFSEEMTDGACLFANDGSFLHANRAFLQILGLDETRRSVLSERWLLDSLADEERINSLAERMRSEADWEAEFEAMRPDGSRFSARVKIMRMLPRKNVRCRAAILQDLTEREAFALAEKKRIKAEESLRRVTRSSRCIIWHGMVTDLGDHLLQNVDIIDEAAAQEILPLEVMPGQDYSLAWSESRHPDDWERSRMLTRQAYREGKSSYQQEFRHINRFGECQWLYEDVSIQRIGPRKWRSVGVCADITEKKRIELALAENEEKFRSLIENSGDGVFLVDDHGIIMYTSPSTLSILGYEPSHLVGRFLSDLIREEDREDAIQALERLRLDPSAKFRSIYRIRHQSGCSKWLEAVSGDPHKNSSVRALVINFRDITEKIEANERIQFQASLLDQVRNAVIAVDQDGFVVYWNKRAEILYQRTRREMMGARNPTLDVLSRDRREEIERRLESEGFWEGEIVVERQDGSLFDASLDMTVLRDTNGKPNGSVISVADITDRKRMEVKLRSEDEIMRRFFERLKRLHEFNLRLSHEPSLDALCERVVEFGKEHLGLDRLSLWLKTDDPDAYAGTYGTDERGCIQSEHHRIVKLFPERKVGLYDNRSVIARSNWPLRGEDNRIIGRGWHLTAAIRERDEVIGILFADNSLNGHAFDESEIELFGLFGAVIGDLITRMKSLDALADSENRFRLLVETSNVVPWEIDIDERRLVYVGPQSAELLGFSINSPVRLSSIRKRVHLEDRRKIKEEFRRLIRHESADGWLEFRLLKADGGVAWMQNFFGMSILPDGHHHLQGFMIDSTERKEAEIRLSRSNELLRLIFDNIPLMINLYDRENRLIFANRFWETTLNRSADDYKRNSVFDDLFGDPDQRNEALEFIQRAEGRWRDFRIKTNENQWIDSSWMNVSLSDGMKLGIGENVTEWKRMEEQLQRGRKMEEVGRLAGGVAHDFNNMLSVINGYCDILLQRIPPEEPAFRQIEKIRTAGERSKELTNQLLAFSRKRNMESRSIDLNEIVRRMDPLIRRLIGEDIDLVVSLSDDLKSVKVDPSQFEQALMNFALNARDAMEDGGTLAIETANEAIEDASRHRYPNLQAGRYVRLSVADTGVGISKEDLERIFEPFFTTKGFGKGAGMSLAAIYGIVKQSDGFIFVESEPGDGARFDLFLPAED